MFRPEASPYALGRMKQHPYPLAGGLVSARVAGSLLSVHTHLSRAGRSLKASLVLALAVLGTGSLGAKDDLGIHLAAQRVVTLASGGEQLRNDIAVDPGDVVQYTAVYKNNSARTLRQVAPTLPIPAGLELVPASTSITPTLASVDGKKFEPYPIRRTQTLADGREVQVEIPAAEYRALRWNPSDLAPGADLKITMRARVATSTTTVALR